jgi:hypothetical protein
MTLSFTVAILLASVISIPIVLNTKVMKWYMNKVQKVTENLFEDSFDKLFKEEESV